MLTHVSDLVAVISKAKGAKFCGFTYTAKQTGEVAKLRVILGASTAVLYQKEIAKLDEVLPSLTGLEKIVAQKLLDSRKTSLAVGIGNHPAYTCKGLYVEPEGLAVDVNVKNGTISVCGLVEHKTILQPGEYKVVNHRPETTIRHNLEQSLNLRSSRFRRYLLTNVTRAVLNGETLELETEPVVELPTSSTINVVSMTV